MSTRVADLRFGQPLAARTHAQPERHVLEHGHVAEQRVVLEHEADVALADAARQRVVAVEQHLSLVRPFEAGDDAQQRRLAGARRAEQRNQLAGLDVQVDASRAPRRHRSAW